MNTSFTIPKPSDMHLHVRQGDVLKRVVPHTTRQFCRAVIMPNTVPPITNLQDLKNYREEIMAAVPKQDTFEPLMTFYLSPAVSVKDIEEGKKSGALHAVKLYPFGVTTNSEQGAKNLDQVSSQLEALETFGVPLLIHGEDSNPETDVFDREKVFYQETLPKLIKKYPKLKITCEHITTEFAAQFIAQSSVNIGATITPQHLSCDRNDMLGKGINPHLYCKPILKRKEDQIALLKLVFSGHPRVFAGTDSAPHTQDKKESCCGCAGVYSAYSAVEHYAEVFDSFGDLSNPTTQELFRNFMSKNGADFYGLPESSEVLSLTKNPTQIPAFFSLSDNARIVPWKAGDILQWSVT